MQHALPLMAYSSLYRLLELEVFQTTSKIKIMCYIQRSSCLRHLQILSLCSSISQPDTCYKPVLKVCDLYKPPPSIHSFPGGDTKVFKDIHIVIPYHEYHNSNLMIKGSDNGDYLFYKVLFLTFRIKSILKSISASSSSLVSSPSYTS